jgi:hypothetical protein
VGTPRGGDPVRHDIVMEPRARRWNRPLWPFLAVSLALSVACANSGAPGGTPSPSGSPKSVPALELTVLDTVGGRLDYCDPDVYPVGRDDALAAAKARFPTIQADHAAFEAILAHEHLSAGQRFTDEQLIAINDLYKQMQAIQLEPSGDGYRFDLFVPQPGSDSGNQEVIGTVSTSGAVTIQSRKPGKQLPCPICLTAGVRIATPSGEVLITQVRAGMTIWTTDRQGRRVVGIVLETGRMEAPLGHLVVRLELADGRTVVASPGHPTADGRTVGELAPGQRYDGSTIVAAALLPYTGFTYDLLPSGPTGAYFANGVLLGSTLAG